MKFRSILSLSGRKRNEDTLRTLRQRRELDVRIKTYDSREWEINRDGGSVYPRVIHKRL